MSESNNNKVMSNLRTNGALIPNMRPVSADSCEQRGALVPAMRPVTMAPAATAPAAAPAVPQTGQQQGPTSGDSGA
jgi:hypothetical protein